jgi:Ca2+-binding RTX toxin-like protein
VAILTTKPDLTDNIADLSSSGLSLLNKITAKTVWGETSLQYYFGDASTLDEVDDFYYDYYDSFSGAPVAFAFKTLTERAFRAIDSVSKLDFSKTTDLDEADQVIVSANDPDSEFEGFFEFPGDYFRGPPSNGDSWSFGVFNSGFPYMLKAAETGGGEYANWTVLHEIGHSLGLKHTHSESTGNALTVVGKYMDNERYSVMSYNPASSGTAYGHAVTFMALDVASIQAVYGAEAYATGDSTYLLADAKTADLDLSEGNVEIGRAYYCIWDSAGVDEINYAGTSSSVMINLNDATLDTSKIASDVKAMISELKTTAFYRDLSTALQQEIVDPWHHAGGFFTRVLDLVSGTYKAAAGGYSIAHGVTIENAFGGSKADLLIGNEASNSLYGLSGNDTMLGSGGADYLLGGRGNDRIDGGKGSDYLTGDAGSDRFIFSNGYGKDVITDFTHQDLIDLRDLTGFNSYSDLFKNHMKNSSGDVVITVGSDELIIEGYSKSELRNSDFII